MSLTSSESDAGPDYLAALDGYDRGGLPCERALTRLGYCRWLLARSEVRMARDINAVTLDLSRRHQMRIHQADAWTLEADAALQAGEDASAARAEASRLRQKIGYQGPDRP